MNCIFTGLKQPAVSHRQETEAQTRALQDRGRDYRLLQSLGKSEPVEFLLQVPAPEVYRSR